jgi:predicted aldo/keto reductase-like oxidoreductase
MQYRKFGKLDWQASALGFGCMRLPTAGGDNANIDEPEATRMLHYAIDRGVNYLDTAYPYHGGNSERLVGRALKGGYREKVKLATKLPCWLVKTAGDFDQRLNEQLEKLQTDHIDFYLLHGLNKDRWPQMLSLDVLTSAEKAIADGRIGHVGFSFHDSYEVFKEIVDGYDKWVFCQIQYNYMDVEEQAGTRGLKYAADKGLAVVIMEPVRGGALAGHVAPTVQMVWDSAPTRRTPADWALQWVWHQPEVSVVLSGMSTMEQVEQNVASADRSGVGALSAEELALVDRVREAYRGLCAVPCTACKYCQPCPNEVNIPRVFEIYNDYLMYGNAKRSRMFYNWLDEKTRADSCQECEDCLEECPQNIDIPEWLKKAHEVLAAQAS